MKEEYKTINKELTINLGTLNAYGEYTDSIYLHDEKIRLRLIVKKETPVTQTVHQLTTN